MRSRDDVLDAAPVVLHADPTASMPSWAGSTAAGDAAALAAGVVRRDLPHLIPTTFLQGAAAR